MEDAKLSPQCPVCGVDDTPRLIVRGANTFTSGSALPNVHLRCRECGHEWSDLPHEQWAS
jgi:uncharacterized Zn finger protein